MSIRLAQQNDTACISVTGKFAFDSHREFRRITQAAVAAPGTCRVHVNLAHASDLDSAALGMLLLLRDKAGACDKPVAIATCAGEVRDILAVADFARYFELVEHAPG